MTTTSSTFNMQNNQQEENLESQINNATSILDRTQTLISNCDNKTSIILTAIGALSALIFNDNSIQMLSKIIKTCFKFKNFCDFIYLLCFISCILILFFGLYNLCSVLIARTKSPGNPNTLIFFAGIVTYKDSKDYQENFYAMSQKNYLDELIGSIFINSEIATIKYKKYNLGLKTSIIGFIGFIIMFIIGVFVY